MKYTQSITMEDFSNYFMKYDPVLTNPNVVLKYML